MALRPPLEPRVPGMLWPLDPAALEDEARHEAVELANLRAPKAALRRVAVEQARLTGADLSEASLSDVTFGDCRIDLASLAAAVGVRATEDEMRAPRQSR